MNRQLRVSIAAAFAALALSVVPIASLAGEGSGQQGESVTQTVDVQLTVLPLCKSVSVVGDKIAFSAVPSVNPVTTTFQVKYECAANSLPTLAFLSKNNCNLLPDDKTNSDKIPYQITGPWGNQLACTSAQLPQAFYPIRQSPSTYTLTTAPLLQTDPHVFMPGTYGDTITATLDF